MNIYKKKKIVSLKRLLYGIETAATDSDDDNCEE